MGRKNSLTYDLQHSPALDGLRNKQTAKTYRQNIGYFGNYCKDVAGIRYLDRLSDPEKTLQAYADYLEQHGYSPSTIHTRLSGPCRALRIPLGSINKPKRHVGLNTRSRRFCGDIKQGDREIINSKYSRLALFQQAVGIRRAELAALTGQDYVQDKSGAWCVYVRKGKGGKSQLQRILPDDVDFVKSYFDGSSACIFSVDEMSNHIDLHGMRADHAKDCYKYYVDLMAHEPTMRNRLISDMVKRYSSFHSAKATTKFANKLLNKKTRICRGDNAEKARRIYGTDTLDYTAIMAVSIYHLSHWRADVTVSNYLLSIR